MLIGNKATFAVEFEILEYSGEWIFGPFYFWISDRIVGNPNDQSVDLKGCFNWLKGFLENQKNRFEPGLFDCSKEKIHDLLMVPNLVDLKPISKEVPTEEIYQSNGVYVAVIHWTKTLYTPFC